MEKLIEEYSSVWETEDAGKTVIKVVGVGGAGGNVLNTMITRMTDADVEFIAANTDQQALSRSLAPVKIPLGTTGLGAGMRPEVGFQAANDARDVIADKLRGADMVFITAGMGGGTGTGASPVFAEVAQELGILTVAVVTKPFTFEGNRRMRIAEQGLQQLKNRVHSLIVILNDKLEEILGADASMGECFEKADEVLYNACSGIAELIQKVGLVNVDFEDVRTVMGARGTAMMGAGEAEGPDRAINAASQAISCPLLEGVQLKGARGLLVNISGSKSLRMSEYRTAMETIKNFADPDAVVVCGAVVDDSLGDKLRVTVIATGLDQEGTDTTYVKDAVAHATNHTENSSQLWKSNSAPAQLDVDLFGAPLNEPKPKSKVEMHKSDSKVAPKPEPIPHASMPHAPMQPQSAATSQPSVASQPQASEPVKESAPVQPQASPFGNPFAQAVSRPIASPDAPSYPANRPTDNTIFGNNMVRENVRTASDVFATLKPQQGNDSGLWTTNPQANASEASPVAKSEEKPVEASGFEYGIPTFLRKK